MRKGHSLFLSSAFAFAGVAIAIGCSSENAGFDEDKVATDPTKGGTAKVDGGTSGFGGNPAGALVLEPKHATVIIDTATNPPTAGTITYAATKDGNDVTSGAKFTIDDASLGSFNGATFTSLPTLPPGVLGKSGIVQVSSEQGQGAGALTVVQFRKTGDKRDFFFLVPYNEEPSPKNDILKFSTNIKQVDVVFSMDTTGSMRFSIEALKSALGGTLMQQLQAAIPNVGLAVVDHKDFWSQPSDPWSVLVRQTVTTDLGLAKSAVDQMSASGGGDDPEAQVAALFHALTGKPNSAPPQLNTHYPPAGRYGGVDFRPGSVPVLVEISDALWKDPAGDFQYYWLKQAFLDANAKFVNIVDTFTYGGPEGTADDLSDATNSNVPPSAFGSACGGQCCTDVNGGGRSPNGPNGSCRLNFRTTQGNGVSSGIVQAISAIAVGSRFDVTAKPSNDPANPNGVDATKFIKTLRAMEEGNVANGCPSAEAKDTNGDGIKDMFVSVTSGTPVCFEIIPAMNTTVPPLATPQFYKAFIDVRAIQGDLPLDQRSVTFMVPPKAPGVN